MLNLGDTYANLREAMALDTIDEIRDRGASVNFSPCVRLASLPRYHHNHHESRQHHNVGPNAHRCLWRHPTSTPHQQRHKRTQSPVYEADVAISFVHICVNCANPYADRLSSRNCTDLAKFYGLKETQRGVPVAINSVSG
jgi:hypothetical protein